MGKLPWIIAEGSTCHHSSLLSESESCSVMSDSVTPRTVQSMEFSWPEYWSGYLPLLQGIFPTQGSSLIAQSVKNLPAVQETQV